jgi:uncharacterized ion transporter superfamily protein YfcC
MAEYQSLQGEDIIQAFRQVYLHTAQNVTRALPESSNTTVLAQITDELNEYQGLFLQVCAFYINYITSLFLIVCSKSFYSKRIADDPDKSCSYAAGY